MNNTTKLIGKRVKQIRMQSLNIMYLFVYRKWPNDKIEQKNTGRCIHKYYYSINIFIICRRARPQRFFNT